MSESVGAKIVALEEALDKRSRLERQIQEAKSAYTIGLLGVLAGLVLIPAFGLGLLLIAAGGLAAMTNRDKRKSLQEELETLEKTIRALRIELAEQEGAPRRLGDTQPTKSR